MGILNVTPDSFSDGGELRDVAAAVERAGEMLAAGAAVLDIGGESTRPGASPVGEGEELARVLPALRAIREKFPQAPISIDTFKPRVAEAAIHAGADIVNDVWGLMHGLDADARAAMQRELVAGSPAPAGRKPGGAALWRTPMATAVARLGCPVVLMHNRPDRNYRDFWADLLADLRLSVLLAEQAGVERGQIWVDPGFGFAKSPAQNLEALKHLDRVAALGFPVLLGTSRKSTIGKVLGTTVENRDDGTAATVVWGVSRGCHMVRVHDVAAVKRFVQMADAIAAGLEMGWPDMPQ